MLGRYFISRGRARVVRVFALLCFLIAGAGAATLPTMLVGPQWQAFMIDCDDGCRPKPQPLDQLSPEVRHVIASLPRAPERMTAAMADPYWWWRLFGIQTLNVLPFAILFFSVGMALWRFSSRQEHRDWSGIRWLQRATAAGIVMAVAEPVAQVLRDAVYLTAVADIETFSHSIDFTEIIDNLLFAGAAWAAIWALAAGLRARGDLAEIV
ncbi:hypothetical protein [Sphingomonas sp. Leaf21]|jgi:hypothetical protein|uniref:hypothetical protein n=1 Tax=Sphingomonas sp. Leaf21 TaxID=2876550 RepID=UPI001E3F9BC1|nr:hypothetical protein [Sphingomonas sp. Leaf21]